MREASLNTKYPISTNTPNTPLHSRIPLVAANHPQLQLPLLISAETGDKPHLHHLTSSSSITTQYNNTIIIPHHLTGSDQRHHLPLNQKPSNSRRHFGRCLCPGRARAHQALQRQLALPLCLSLAGAILGLHSFLSRLHGKCPSGLTSPNTVTTQGCPVLGPCSFLQILLFLLIKLRLTHFRQSVDSGFWDSYCIRLKFG